VGVFSEHSVGLAMG